MPSKKNITQLAETKDRVNRATAVFFAEYQGITHKTLEEARHTLAEFNSEISITKNRLINLALKDKKIEAEEKLQGPLAAFFAYEDPLPLAKALFAFFKKNSDISRIKFGVFEGKLVDDKTLLALSALPSKELLLGKLVGLLKSPMTGLVYSLNWNVQKLVLLLKEVEKKKGASVA